MPNGEIVLLRNPAMRDHESAMCAYVQLAALSQQKRQSPSRDRFLLLTGTEACRAGCLDVAERCHDLLRRCAPALRLAGFPSFPEALRDDAVAGVVARWERWCPYERAEHLLMRLGRNPSGDCPEAPRADWVIDQLAGIAGDLPPTE